MNPGAGFRERKGGSCFPVGGEAPVADEGIPAFNRALDQFYPPAPARESGVAKVSRARSREERIRVRQAEILSQYERKVARNERIVELMYESYPLLQDIITTLDQVSRTKSWQEISKILDAQDSGPAAKIVSVNPAEASVDVDIGERVTLFVHEGLEASIGRYFDATKKLKRKIAGARTA